MTLDLHALAVGDELPPLEPGRIDRATLAVFGPASGDLHPVHLDLDVARAAGFEDVFAHGMLSMACLGRMVTGWAEQRCIRFFSARFRALTPIHAWPVCRGVVSTVLDVPTRTVTVALTVTLADGTVTVTGEVVLAVPVHGLGGAP